LIKENLKNLLSAILIKILTIASNFQIQHLAKQGPSLLREIYHPCYEGSKLLYVTLVNQQCSARMETISSTWRWLSYLHSVFLGSFAELRKMTVSFVVSVCPSVLREQFGSCWRIWMKCGIWAFLENLLGKIQVSVKC